MKKILFVCTGNICRSPTAHAIARHKVKKMGLDDKFYFDSAGITSFHEGERSDPRSIEVGAQNGVSFEGIFARQIKQKDFQDFDLILAMDKGHYNSLIGLADEDSEHKIKLFLKFCEVQNSWKDEVIDPYYLKSSDFAAVFETLEKAVEKLIAIYDRTKISL